MGLWPKPLSTSNRLISLTMPKEKDFIFALSVFPAVPLFFIKIFHKIWLPIVPEQ